MLYMRVERNLELYLHTPAMSYQIIDNEFMKESTKLHWNKEQNLLNERITYTCDGYQINKHTANPLLPISLF